MALAGGGPLGAEFAALDRAWRRHLKDDTPGGSLLLQTIAAAPERRRHLGILAARPGDVVCDVGTGFGALLLEVARRTGILAVGVDPDAEVLARTADVAASLGDWFAPGARVRFVEAGAEALPFATESVDVVLLRLVLQHLPTPELALAEARRVLRPGGRVVVIDVDDALSLTHPEPSAAQARLEAAFARWQARYGGDRRIGRRIAPMLTAAGFSVTAVDVRTQAAFVTAADRSLERRIDLARLRAAAGGLAGAGGLDAGVLRGLLETFESEAPPDTVRVEGQFVVTGERPHGEAP